MPRSTVLGAARRARLARRGGAARRRDGADRDPALGGRDGLFAAAAEREADRVRRQRDEATAGDLARAVRVVVDHYEAMGDRVLRMLAVEQRVPRLREIADRGRALSPRLVRAGFRGARAGRAPRTDAGDRVMARVLAYTSPRARAPLSRRPHSRRAARQRPCDRYAHARLGGRAHARPGLRCRAHRPGDRADRTQWLVPLRSGRNRGMAIRWI